MSLVKKALECGATKAEVIFQTGIVVSASFRKICEGNGCGKYNRCYMCPPDVGDIHRLMTSVKRYPQGLLYQTIHQIEDSFDFEGMMQAGKNHMSCSQRLQQALVPVLGNGILHLSCGGCRLCDACAKPENKPCRFPEQALPSMESYGIDVYKTAQPTDLKYINGTDTVTYFGLVLYEEEADA